MDGGKQRRRERETEENNFNDVHLSLSPFLFFKMRTMDYPSIEIIPKPIEAKLQDKNAYLCDSN